MANLSARFMRILPKVGRVAKNLAVFCTAVFFPQLSVFCISIEFSNLQYPHCVGDILMESNGDFSVCCYNTVSFP